MTTTTGQDVVIPSNYLLVALVLPPSRNLIAKFSHVIITKKAAMSAMHAFTIVHTSIIHTSKHNQKVGLVFVGRKNCIGYLIR